MLSDFSAPEPETESHYLFLNPGTALTWSADLCKSIPGRAVRTPLHYGRWKARFSLSMDVCAHARWLIHYRVGGTSRLITGRESSPACIEGSGSPSTDAGRGGYEHFLFRTTNLLSARYLILSSMGILHPRPHLTAASLVISLPV